MVRSTWTIHWEISSAHSTGSALTDRPYPATSLSLASSSTSSSS